MGYRPDPALAALNHYRHGGKSKQDGYVLAYVTCFEKRDGWQQSPFFQRAYAGARVQAEALGFRLEHAWLGEPGVSPQRFAQVLESRGIRGLVIAPLPRPASRLWLPWERFSCVAIGPSLVDPALHSACGDQYQAMILALDRLAQRGYRRVGLLLDPEADQRHQRKYQAALAITTSARSPRPLIASRPADSEVRAWLRREKPDVVLSSEDAAFDRLVALGLSVPRRIGFASLVRSGRREISGVETFPEQIAAAAINRLQQLLYENETGVPELPACSMLPGSVGRWRDHPAAYGVCCRPAGGRAAGVSRILSDFSVQGIRLGHAHPDAGQAGGSQGQGVHRQGPDRLPVDVAAQLLSVPGHREPIPLAGRISPVLIVEIGLDRPAVEVGLGPGFECPQAAGILGHFDDHAGALVILNMDDLLLFRPAALDKNQRFDRVLPGAGKRRRAGQEQSIRVARERHRRPLGGGDDAGYTQLFDGLAGDRIGPVDFPNGGGRFRGACGGNRADDGQAEHEGMKARAAERK
ncbi:MAG: substrate-binding domain-containing protein [Lacunisphaera sp.]